MKIAALALLAILFVSSPLAVATPPAKTKPHHATHINARRNAALIATARRIVAIRKARERSVKAHIRKELGGDYADALFLDRRFRLDRSIYWHPAEKPEQPQPHPRRPRIHNYDYVFSNWSLERGRSFLKDNAAAFAQEEEKFGVPREVINALLDIETQWGRNTGKALVVPRLYTLAVLRPNLVQPGWPEEQLIAFLGMCKNDHVDPFSVKGSPTGAFGLAQFEPTSFNAFSARCSDDGGQPNPFNTADAICSTGNYLKQADWGASNRSEMRAIHAYNHEWRYVDAVMDFYDLTRFQTIPYRYRFIHRVRIERAALIK